jgi:hypothetical protein
MEEMKKLALMALGAVILSASVASAGPIQLITNGDFEAGSLVGWTVTDQAGGSGSWFWDAPGTTTPLSGFPTQATAANGLGYAVSDQGGPGTHVLSQAFTVNPSSSVILSFDMFANDQSNLGPLYGGQGLDYTGAPNQFARVDIMSSGAGAFDTGGVLANYFTGVDAGADPNAFTSYLFDITALVGGGGNFVLRFAEVDNQLFFNMGVDNVSIQAVPEPASLLLLGMGAAGFAARVRRQKTALAS